MFLFTFVILHYACIEDTIECVESILSSIDYLHYKIIIVDNGSPNGSGETLIKRYHLYKEIVVILNKENLGYAKGNNVGFQIAKHQYRSDFIIIINPDTVITQGNFIETIMQLYQQHKFSVLGPDIVSISTQDHQNPMAEKGFTEKEVIHYRRNAIIRLILNYLGIENIIENIYKCLKREANGKKQRMNPNIEHKDVVLHGSCLIFSPSFVSVFEGLYSHTFMFLEEEILYNQLVEFGMTSLYSPDITIFHKEDSSLDFIFPKGFLKRRFYYKNRIKSFNILQKVLVTKDFS